MQQTLNPQNKPNSHESRKYYTSLILCILFGGLGAHRFYLQKEKALFMLLTLGGFGFMLWNDLLLIVAGEFTDGMGRKISNPNPKLNAVIFGLFFTALALFAIIGGVIGVITSNSKK